MSDAEPLPEDEPDDEPEDEPLDEDDEPPPVPEDGVLPEEDGVCDDGLCHISYRSMSLLTVSWSPAL